MSLSIAAITTVIKGFFSNSWMKWAGIGLVVLAVGLYVGWLKYDNAQKDVAIERLVANQGRLEASNAALDMAKDELVKVNAAHAAAAAEWARDVKEMNRRWAAERRQWQEVVRNDPETRAWADTPLPAGVRGRLQRQTAD